MTGPDAMEFDHRDGEPLQVRTFTGERRQATPAEIATYAAMRSRAVRKRSRGRVARELGQIAGFVLVTLAAGLVALALLYGVAGGFGRPVAWEVEPALPATWPEALTGARRIDGGAVEYRGATYRPTAAGGWVVTDN